MSKEMNMEKMVIETEVLENIKKEGKIKTHFKKHKDKYVYGTIGLVVGGVTTYCVCKGFKSHNNANVVVKQGIAVNSPVTNNIKQVTELVKRGHAGYIVECIETGEKFASVRRAAQMFGVSPSTMRNHLKGTTGPIDGMNFEIVGEM